MLLDARSKADYHIDHPRAGTFIAVSSRDSWFSYYWWEERAKEPHFAPHVDIHRKPGYDPLELFIEPGTFKVPQDIGLIKGSHGYPPLTEQDYLPLIISGSGVKGKMKLPRTSASPMSRVLSRRYCPNTTMFQPGRGQNQGEELDVCGFIADIVMDRHEYFSESKEDEHCRYEQKTV